MSKRKLERDQERAVISGVLAGLARYFSQDPVLFRIAAIIFLIITGVFPGLLFYLAAWIFMPKQDNRLKADYEIG
jgi:phage shock protein C